MVNITSLKVVDKETETVTSEFQIDAEPPAQGDIVWVPDNGDVAYYVEGRRFNYKDGVVILGCVKNEGFEQDAV